MLSFNNSGHNKKTVAGFNTGHHAGCCIIHDGKVVSISEERLNRKKYSDGYLYSFAYCLKALGIQASDVDLFVSSSYHKRLPERFKGEFGVFDIPEDRFITVDHHLSHAYSAYATSPFDSALVLAIDGLGNETDTETYYLGEGTTLTKIGGNDPQRSIYKGIGRAYESFTNFIGWSAQEAGKTMGLAAYGEETRPELDLYKISPDGKVESALEGKYQHGALNFVKEHNLDFGAPFSGFENKNAAFFVQDRTEKVILDLVRRLYEKHQIKNLCLSGGVFLNSIINKKILDETPIENVFVPPCCDDTGQPFGNALYGYTTHFGNPFSIKMEHAYLGRDYGEDEILDVLQKKQEKYALPYETKSCDFEFQKSANVAEEAAQRLSEGKLIGWFQGASEVGPRALGHRSILTAPFPAEMKEILNARIKHREGFRPFAPAILEERVAEYFDLDRPSPFMLLIAEGKENQRESIPAVLHVDSTARVQTVRKEREGNFHELVSAFERLTGVPVVLNTSFNDSGEPIVENPRDALNMFCRSELDYLFIGDYVVWKKIEIRLPRLTEEVYIGSEILSETVTLIKDLDYDGFLVVIDKGAYKASKERFDRLFSQLSITAERVIKLTPTHESKDFHTVEKILRRLTAFDATRRACILAIGGGYVGDVVGFASAIYMRGIHFVQIPTTFMAQADAIIGKVAINFEGKKNQLGAFYSPRLVFCDISFIDGFAFKELVYGLVEVWKHALLVNDTATVKSIESLLASNGQNTDYKSLIRFSLETKGRFVEQDPEDVHGSHKALSLGHTLANVLETSLRLRHGAAVFYGLLFETILARNLGKISAERFSAIMNTGFLFEKRLQKLAHIKRFIKRKNLVRALRGDKINSHGRYSFVIPGEAGYEIVKDLDADVINRTAKEFSIFKFDS